MITIKTPQEIEKMKKAATILAEVKQVVWDSIKPGMTLLDIDAIAEKEINKRGAKSNFKGYGGFPNVACISVNEILIHGIPNDYVVKDGDLVKVDLGCTWEGYHADSAFMKPIGVVSPETAKVMNVAIEAFKRGLNAIKPGARVGDVSAAIGDYVKSQGMFVPTNFTGHGIGTAMHEDPYVPNEGNKKTGPLLKNGMVICIEPMIIQTTKDVKILGDGWTVKALDGKHTAHYEHTILIEDGHGVVLTEGI